MSQPISLADLGERVAQLAKRVHDLEHNSNKILARETANAAVLHTVLWAWGKSREELTKALLEGGAASLAHVNTMPAEMQQEVVNVWNHAYATLANPKELPFVIGEKPQVTKQFG